MLLSELMVSRFTDITPFMIWNNKNFNLINFLRKWNLVLLDYVIRTFFVYIHSKEIVLKYFSRFDTPIVVRLNPWKMGYPLFVRGCSLIHLLHHAVHLNKQTNKQTNTYCYPILTTLSVITFGDFKTLACFHAVIMTKVNNRGHHNCKL